MITKKKLSSSVLFVCLLFLVCLLGISQGGIYLATATASDGEGVQLFDSSKKDDEIVEATDFDMLTNLHLIPNSNYFIANPQHAKNDGSDNKKGSCTTVAMQILIGYHNYYSDRRILPKDRDDGEPFLSADYGVVKDNPIIRPTKAIEVQGRASIGTEDTVYHEIFNNTTGASIPGIGQAIPLVVSGAEKFIKKYAPSVSNNISIDWGILSETAAISEIDKGNPLLVGFDMLFSEAKSYHVVVAYGYAYHNGELGFIVHYGWGNYRNQVWIPADWLGFQVTMSVAHTHNYVDTGETISNTKNIYKVQHCDVCKSDAVCPIYRTGDGGKTITDVDFDFTGEIAVPQYIDGVTITKIGDGAFANSKITKVTLPYTVKTIGANAFENCSALENIGLSNITEIGNNAFSGCGNLTSISALSRVTSIGSNAFKNCVALTNISIPSSVNYIGDGAFAGCDNLDITVASSNPYYTANDNILYNKDKTKIVATGEIASNVVIPSTVTEIAPYAFKANSNLISVCFNETAKISDYAFASCVNLGSVEFKSYIAPTVGNNMFANTDCTIFVPYSSMDEYKAAFAQYADRIESKEIVVSFESEGQSIEPKIVHYGETIELTAPNERIGYTFAGWYDDPDFEGEPIVCGGKWECEYGITLYAKWISNDCKITLDPSEGNLEGERVHFVKYGEAFHINVAVEKEGQVFDGWYDAFGVKHIDENGDSVNVWHIAEDITLYAQWRPKSYTIYIDNEGMVTWLSKDGLSSSETTVEFGMKIRISDLYDIFADSDAGKKEGHVFQRFQYEYSDCEKWESIPDLGPDGAVIELKPIWRPKYNTIYFNVMYNSKGPDPISKNYGEDIALPKPTRIGYVFLGWKEASGGYVYWVKMPDLNIGEQRDGSVMLFAHWAPITYSVNYNANGGSGKMSPTLCQYDADFDLSKNTFTRTGHDFLGWAESADGVMVHVDGKNVKNLTTKSNAIVQLYAVWKAKTYNIICKNLTTDMTVDIKSYTYGEGLSAFMMPRVFRSDGRVSRLFEGFEGWYTSTSFTVRVASISSTRTGDIMLYAKYDLAVASLYDANTYTVTDKIAYPYFAIDVNFKSYLYNAVKNTTLKKIVISVQLDLWEVDDGYQIIRWFNGGTLLDERKYDHAGNSTGKTATRYSYTFELDLEKYKDVDNFNIRFYADGWFSDDWQFKNLNIDIKLAN